MKGVVKNYLFGRSGGADNSFIADYDTRNTLTGSSNSGQVKLTIPAVASDLQVKWQVDWGDGVVNTVESKSDPNLTHTYSSEGIYTVKIKPLFEDIYYRVVISFIGASQQLERQKIVKVRQWGTFFFSATCFQNCINMDLSEVVDVPLLDNLSSNSFQGCFNGTRFTTINRFSEWNFGNTTSVSPLVYSNTNFNQDFTINAPSATKLTIAWLCAAFNGNLVINAPNLTDLDQCFRQSTAFNKPVHNIGIDWTKITNMSNFMTGKTSANYNASYYDDLLIALDAGGKTGVTLGMGTIKYTSAGASARANLVTKSWTITDGGLV